MIENYKNMDAVFEQIFGYKPSKRGKGFEMLVGAVLKIINEANDVTHNVKKTGLFSPDRYQIDVLVDDNEESLFVEAKDYSERKRKTGRGDAQKLAGALNNLDIDKGLLISATGFTSPTIKYSKSTKVNPNAKEINICLIRPASKKDTENLIFELAVDATFQMMDHSKSKSDMLLNQESLNKAMKELKKEGLGIGKHESRVDKFFDKNGNHLAYVHDIITTKLPSEVEGTHKGTWIPKVETFVKFKGKLIKIDGVEYEFIYNTHTIKDFVHIKEEPILIAKSEDLELDYIITKRQLEGITFEASGNIKYQEQY